MTPQTPDLKYWVCQSLSHPPPIPQSPASFNVAPSSHLPPAEKCECSVRRSWLAVTAHYYMTSYIQYILSCLKSQRSTPYNIAKSGLPWKRVFRRRHLGRRVAAVTCLRWPTVCVKQQQQQQRKQKRCHGNYSTMQKSILLKRPIVNIAL